MSDAPREKTFLLARAEQRLLQAIAVRVPGPLMPDHFTALGLAAAAGIAGAYVLSNGGDALWLWAAAALIVVQWLGDSLDGTLARVRRTERPKYGYYLDHLVDALSTALIGLGLGLSEHMLLASGLLLVIAYLVLSINTYLETQVLGVFSLGYAGVGPTEARLGLLALTVALALGAVVDVHVLGVGLGLLDLAGLAAAALMLLALLIRGSRNLRLLALREPPGKVRPHA